MNIRKKHKSKQNLTTTKIATSKTRTANNKKKSLCYEFSSVTLWGGGFAPPTPLFLLVYLLFSDYLHLSLILFVLFFLVVLHVYCLCFLLFCFSACVQNKTSCQRKTTISLQENHRRGTITKTRKAKITTTQSWVATTRLLYFKIQQGPTRGRLKKRTLLQIMFPI